MPDRSSIYIPNQAPGDIDFATPGGEWSRLAIGTSGQFLKVASGLPSWATLAGSDLPAESITSDKLAPVIILETCTGNSTTSGTTETDITGCTSTFTPSIASTVEIEAYVDVQGDTAGDVFHLLCDVDTANEASVGRYEVIAVPAVGIKIEVLAYKWVRNLTAASHTIKLQLVRSSGTGTATATATNSKMVIKLMGDNNATIS